MKKCCDMKGFLTFSVLCMIKHRDMSGDDIRNEIEKRKGTKPSPGTIYPVLKTLTKGGLIVAKTEGKQKKYHLTKHGKEELQRSVKQFVSMFCDMKDHF